MPTRKGDLAITEVKEVEGREERLRENNQESRREHDNNTFFVLSNKIIWHCVVIM